MTSLSAPLEHDDVLYFAYKPVRIIRRNGVPWFALPDICEAIGFPRGSAFAVDSSRFPAHAKLACLEATEPSQQPKDLTVLSPVGVWWFTALTDPGKGQRLAAWARREAKRLCPDADPSDRAMFLTAEITEPLPPRPLAHSGRRAEWNALRDARPLCMVRPSSLHLQEKQAALLAEAAARHAATGKA